jgi:hypothetical protein
MNKYLTGAIIAILLFVGGVLTGKYYFAKTDIKVVDRTIYTTVYKEATPTEFNQQNFDLLKLWVNSPIQFKDRTEKNYLFVTAFDLHKENTARYEIGTYGDWKVYAIIGGLGAIAGGYTIYKLTR